MKGTFFPGAFYRNIKMRYVLFTRSFTDSYLAPHVLLDKSFAVQNGRIFNAGDQCQVFCHLSAFNRGKGCFSSLSANTPSCGILSSSPRLRSAPVHAKIVATEFVDVSSPFRYL